MLLVERVQTSCSNENLLTFIPLERDKTCLDIFFVHDILIKFNSFLLSKRLKNKFIFMYSIVISLLFLLLHLMSSFSLLSLNISFFHSFFFLYYCDMMWCDAIETNKRELQIHSTINNRHTILIKRKKERKKETVFFLISNPLKQVNSSISKSVSLMDRRQVMK